MNPHIGALFVVCCGFAFASPGAAQEGAPGRRLLDSLVPDVRVSASVGMAVRDGTMVTPTRTPGLLVEGGLRWAWFGASIGDLYLGETAENLFFDLQLGSESVAAVVGIGTRSPDVIYEGSDSGTFPWWTYHRMGARSRLPMGSTGFATDLRLVIYRGMKPDEMVFDPRDEAGSPLTPRARGGEFESALEYVLPRDGFFFRLGYRIEVMEVEVDNAFDPGTEAIHLVFIGGGYLPQHRRRVPSP